MRQFYRVYPISAELPHQLSWTHWVELLKIDDPLERSFYLNQATYENWSTTELIRQKKSALFFRLAASKDKEGILQLARQGQMVEKPEDIIREPYVLDFLQVPEPYHLSETELESRIISKLQSFLLELGRGFPQMELRLLLSNYSYTFDSGEGWASARAGDNTKEGIKYICSTSEYIFAVYNPNLSNSDFLDWKDNNEIWIFDWNGNPIKKIYPNLQVTCIVVEKDNKTIYCMVNDPEPTIAMFTIN